LPGAEEPLWQLAQVPMAALCRKVTLVQVTVEWQSSQVVEVRMWVAGRPGARLPSWQAPHWRGVALNTPPA